VRLAFTWLESLKVPVLTDTVGCVCVVV
jgi:hypothetical protein